MSVGANKEQITFYRGGMMFSSDSQEVRHEPLDMPSKKIILFYLAF